MNYYWKFDHCVRFRQPRILQDIPIGNNLDRTLLWPDIAGPSLANLKNVLFSGGIKAMEMN